jgi:hypothetical protein
MTYKRIDFDDDLVLVIDTTNGKEVYRGIEDYEPMKNENWKWNCKEQCYTFDKYKKYCLNN